MTDEEIISFINAVLPQNIDQRKAVLAGLLRVTEKGEVRTHLAIMAQTLDEHLRAQGVLIERP